MFKWILEKLEENSKAYENTVVRVFSIVMFIGMVIVMNITFMIVFSIIDVKGMFIYHTISLVAFSFALYLILGKHRYIVAQYIVVIGFCLYIIYTSYLFGYSKKSYILLFPLIFAIYTIFPIKDKKNLIITGVVMLLTFGVVIYFRFNLYAKYSTTMHFMEIVHATFAICSTIFVLATIEISEKIINNTENSEITKLENEINIDFLTGLWNKRYTEEELSKRIVTENEYIVLGDIDFFKKVNDTYGHCCGDYVLKEVSALMKDFFSDEDLVSRWGGEEFFIYIRDMDLIDLEKRINTLREKIADSVFTFDNVDFKITMTFGVKKIDEGLAMKQNFADADSALYRGKENGRNRVVCFKEKYD